MKHLTSIIALVCASSFATTNSHAQTTTKTHTINEFYQYVGPDIDFQGSIGYHWDAVNSSRNSILGMGRLRGGIMYAPGYPWVLSAGPTLEYNNLTNVVWGAQLEVLNWGAGLWLRAGMGIDYQEHPHYNAAAGWSIFGVEVQGFNASQFDDRSGFAVLGTVRLPLGFLQYVLSKQH